MKKFKCVLSVLAALSFAAQAGAVNRVWFEAAGSQSQGAGQELVLNHGGSAASYVVTMMLRSDVNLLGWANDFTSTTPGLAITGVDQSPASSPFQTDNAAPQLGPTPNLMIGAGSISPNAVAPGTYALMTFTLTTNGAGTQLVFTDIGDFGWADDQFGFGMIQFGGNNAIEGLPGEVASAAVIRLVPEPATVGLLSLGLLGLLRRRR